MDKQLPVSVWPEWKIIEKIGEGSFGKVYKASRQEQGKTFYSAIKVITIPSTPGELNSVRSESPGEQSVREYFYGLVEECIQEVSTMEYFRGNSHVVSVEDYKVVEYLDDIGWDIYIRMEYLTGFLDYCAGRKLTAEDVIQLGMDLCKALEYCQRQNIIHRDIKPENIFVSRFGEFKLGDFGIARELERSASGLSKKGTFSYMAPEMYRGEEYDARVDIYSLGLVLYKLMNQNRLPFIDLKKQLITYRDKENALNRRMAGEQMAPPAEADEAFAKVILKACAYEREDRFSTAVEFRNALERLKYRLLEAKEASVRDKVLPKNPESVYADTSAAVSGNRKKDRSRPAKKIRKKKPGGRAGTSALFVSGVVMAAAVCIVIGVFVWLVRENAELQRLKKSVTETVESAENKQLQTTLEQIQDHATEISENLNNYSWVGSEEEGFIVYLKANSDDTWDLMKVLVYPAQSAEGYYEEYYYWNEEVFLAYIWADQNTLTYLDEDEVKTDIYYYDSEKLIRWIDEDGVCHDNESENEEYVNRGTKYLEQAQDWLYEMSSDVAADSSTEGTDDALENDAESNYGSEAAVNSDIDGTEETVEEVIVDGVSD